MSRSPFAVATRTTDRLSPAMFRARVSLQTAQAHLDAIGGGVAAKAWAEVWDAFHAWVVAAPPT